MAFVGVFAVIGVVALVLTQAATPTASLQPEQGTKTGAVSTVTDTSASGGSAVKFGSQQTNLPDPRSMCSAAVTGVQPGITLTPYTGPTRINDDAVIENKLITGGLEFYGNNLTIRNSKFVGTATSFSSGPWAAVTIRLDGRVELDHVEITGPWSAAAINFLDGFIGNALNVHDFWPDGGKLMGGTELRNSWIHDPTYAPQVHTDGFQLSSDESEGPGMVLENNCIDFGTATDGINAPVFIQDAVGPGDEFMPITVNNNYLNGGGWAVKIDNVYHVTYGASFTNNIIGPNSGRAVIVEYGGPDPVWTNNRDINGNILNVIDRYP